MAATSLDMTAPRPGGASPVYAVYGEPDPAALTLAALCDGGTSLEQIPLDVLVALEAGSNALQVEALAQVDRHDDKVLVGAVGFDDWWNTALAALNPGWPLAEARALVIDKAKLYIALRHHAVPTPEFTAGTLTTSFLAHALRTVGPQPVLKPTTGAGSRGVYRYRGDLSIDDNLCLYRQLLAIGHIDTQTPIIATEYLGGDAALEISVDALVCDHRTVTATVHEKLTATAVHPYVDNIMISPPANPLIIENLPQLPDVLAGIVTTLGMANGALHIEVRLHNQRWHVLDIGVRPGAGLVAHAVQARTGIDPRLAHLAANLGRPLATKVVAAAEGSHHATCIACCYVAYHRRPDIRLHWYSELAAELRATAPVIGWHLNVAEVDDEVYGSDAGLSVGVGAPDTPTGLERLRSLIEPYAFTTTASSEVVASQ
ncbi:ATP-grasp domain-containing protein [Nocardia sp. NPDC049220]|uniref:ATP-grasp domain-containing protein n=1 Tax=Nocardia sp. NPDC049220 TaxID=3155273 RepID=UPI0033E24F6F